MTSAPSRGQLKPRAAAHLLTVCLLLCSAGLAAPMRTSSPAARSRRRLVVSTLPSQTAGQYLGLDGATYTAYILDDPTGRYSDGRRTFSGALAYCQSVGAALSPYDSPALGDSINAIKTLCTARYDTCWLNQTKFDGNCPLLAADGTLQLQGCDQILSFVCRAAPAGSQLVQPTPTPAPQSVQPTPAPIPQSLQPTPMPSQSTAPAAAAPAPTWGWPELLQQFPWLSQPPPAATPTPVPTPTPTAIPTPTVAPIPTPTVAQIPTPTVTPIPTPTVALTSATPTPSNLPSHRPPSSVVLPVNTGLPPAVISYTPLVVNTPISAPTSLLTRYTNTHSSCDIYTCYVNPQPQMLPPDWRQPFPTNWWWSGWTHKQNASNIPAQEAGMMPNQLHPWAVKLRTTGMEVAPPKPLIVSASSIQTPFEGTLTITAADVPFASRRFISANELGGTVQWVRDGASGSMSATLLQGMAMLSFVFDRVAPVISAQAAILQPEPGTYTQSSLVFTLNSGIKYKLYFSESVTVIVAGSTLRLASPFSGVVRLAILSHDAVPSMAYSTDIETIYDTNSDIYPTGATLDLGYTNSGRPPTKKGMVRIFFSTASMSGAYSGQLMMMALPHHRRLLTWPVQPTGTIVHILDLRGDLTHVLGNDWYLQYPLSSITWRAPAGVAADDRRQTLISALLNDADNWAGTTPRDDAYFGGSDMAAMGRMALIADELAETADASMASRLQLTATGLRARLKLALGSVLVTNPGRNSSLVYDTTWGGITTYVSLQYRVTADFGNAHYNDHHYHWGYWLYAAAALGKSDPGWLQVNKDPLLNLVRDFANPRRDDPYFPFTRLKDMWGGHSWASGTDIFGDAKNQESTSEAVNGYYALTLLGLALHDDALTTYGQLLTAMEVESAQEYWHIPSTSSNYPSPFADNKVVGMLWCSKADYGTWFGNTPVFMHGIQWVPFTPMSEDLLAKPWIQESYAIAQAGGLPSAPGDAGWRAFLLMAQATFNPEDAWSQAQALDPSSLYGAFTSHPLSVVLYWILTRRA